MKARQQTTWASGDYAEIAHPDRPGRRAPRRRGRPARRIGRPRRRLRSGNAAIAAARLGAIVTGVDYVPALLERARERAAAERLAIDLRHGDAEALPFADRLVRRHALGVRVDVRARPRRAAARDPARDPPGGTIGLASWTPEGFIGAMFRTVAAHVPPPAGVASPMLWGTESHLAELFGPSVEWTHRTRTFTFRFASAARVRRALRHLLRADAQGDRGRRRRARRATSRTWRWQWSRLERPGPIAVPAAYLESVGVRA